MSRAIPLGRAGGLRPEPRAASQPKALIPIAWLIAAYEAGRADHDPFFERKETL